jgi:hypothetical protein
VRVPGDGVGLGADEDYLRGLEDGVSACARKSLVVLGQETPWIKVIG